MRPTWKVIVGWYTFIVTLALVIGLAHVLSDTPKVKFQPTDHFACDMQGNQDYGPVDVMFLIGRHNKQVVILKTTVDSWKKADAICTSWNDIGYNLEKK